MAGLHLREARLKKVLRRVPTQDTVIRYHGKNVGMIEDSSKNLLNQDCKSWSVLCSLLISRVSPWNE
jgi:hypothetical protein